MSKHQAATVNGPIQGVTAALTTLEAPLVLIDPCTGFSASVDEPEICAACGWLADDHATDHLSRQAA